MFSDFGRRVLERVLDLLLVAVVKLAQLSNYLRVQAIQLLVAQHPFLLLPILPVLIKVEVDRRSVVEDKIVLAVRRGVDIDVGARVVYMHYVVYYVGGRARA